jgi:2,4'-dihydroxyacetophenone dioxygenase
MSKDLLTAIRPSPGPFIGGLARSDAMMWIPGASGKSSKPLRFLRDNQGFIELLRLDPGAVMPLHRHTGEVHAFNVQGSRQLGTGEIIRSGDYVYEPEANVDTWKIVGNEPLVVLVLVKGEVEYLGSDGSVMERVSGATQWEAYCRHCQEMGAKPLDLRD